jgi:hypothetical protein
VQYADDTILVMQYEVGQLLFLKDKGGLGVINLSVQNDALLLKHLYKFYRKIKVPWVRLIWDKYYSNLLPHLAKEKGSFW